MSQDVTLGALLVAAVLTGVIHTIAGPDHYLPFIAIARSRGYGWLKTFFWTLICGIGHVGSALLLAAGFLVFAEILSEAHLEWIEAWRGDIAAYALIGMGAAILLHALHSRWKKRMHQHQHMHADGTNHVHTHSHESPHGHPHGSAKSLSYWVVFIIFVLGPCEALLPLLTASAVLGTASVILVAAVFSVATIVTMLTAVTTGILGLKALRFHFLEHFASEIAGATVMACGLAIAVLGL